MKDFHFLSKSGSQSGSHGVVTLASTVGSPSAHRRGAMQKLLSVLVLILTLGVGNVWGAAGDELASCQGTGSGYGTRRTLTDSHSIGWVLSTGQSGYLGTNNATNHGKVVPTNADLPVVKAQLSTATTSTTGYYFYYTSSAISNVGSIVFSHSATNSNASAAVYVVYSSTAAAASSATWEKVTLSSTSTSAQGANVKNASGGTYTFTFNATQTSAKYYGIIIAVSGAQRFTAGTITIKEGATSQCTNPTTALSVSSSASATVGTPMTLTTANGNGGPVTWEITSGGDKATLDGATLTPTGEGSVTVKATQDDYTTGGKTYCGGNASKTITVTKAGATITLSALGATSSVSGTHYGGDSYTLPTTTTATCTGKVFVGWSRSEIEETDIEPTSNFYAKGEAVTLTAGSNIFYAVFAKAGTPVDASLSASYSSHTGWTETDCCGSSFWVLCTGASLTSPLIDDLSTVSSITLKVRTYGGANYNTVTVKTSSNESVGSADHNNTTLTSKTINVSGLTGSGSLVFTGSATTASYGPGMNDITINYKAATYTKYATTCCTELGSINGSVSGTTQNTATLTWKRLADQVSAWDVKYKEKGSNVEFAAVTKDSESLTSGDSILTVKGLTAGKTYQFKLTATLKSGVCTDKTDTIIEGSTQAAWEITAQSNNTNYGTVSLSGTTITGDPAQYCRYATPAYTVTSGTATVSQNGNEFTVTPSTDCTVQINFEPIPVTGVTMSSDAETLEVGGTVDLTATVAPNTVNPNVTWQSSNTNIATVAAGVVTAVAAGSATITATSVGDNTKSATCAITVRNPYPYVIMDGEALTGTATTEETSEEYTGSDNKKVTAVFSTGAKFQTSTQATNHFESQKSMLIPSGGYVYNSTPIPGVIKKFELYANKGASTAVTVSVTFSTEPLDEPGTDENTLYTATLSTDDHVYDCSDKIPEGARYFYYAVTNNKNSQVQFRIKYEPIVSAVTITAPAEGTGALTLANGQTAVASGDNIEAGTQLTVTATPNSGNHYIGGTIVVTKTVGGDDVTDEVLNGTTLTMPEYAITVSATFTPTYAITKVADGGSIALSYTAGGAEQGYAIAGTAITATATADGSHTFTSIEVSNNVENPSISGNVASFSMPASAVTVTATFAVKEDPSISVTDGTNPITSLNFGSVAQGSTPVAQTFKLSGLHLEEGTLTIESSDEDVFTVSPTSIDVNGTLAETTITVTPVTDNVGTFNDEFIYIHGGGLAQADEATIELSLTVQQTYTAKWFVNGAEQLGSTVTVVAGTPLTFPDAPTPSGDCTGTVFKGWLTAPLDEASDDEPDGLIKTYTGHTMPAAAVNYYAVFAEETPGEEVEDTYSHTIEAQTWSSAGAQTLGGVAWTLANNGNYYGNDGTKGQQVGSGSAPASEMSLTTSGISGKITSVKIYTSGASSVSATVAASVNGVAYKNNNSTSPVAISSTNTGYEFTGSETGEIVISWAQTSSKALYFKQIEVRYATPGASTYSNYVTTCVACSNVSLVEAGETNGTITLKQGANAVSSVKTCNGAVTLTTNAVAETGYELTNIAVSGVANAEVNQAMTEITIPANATGELTVTATFAQKNYSITMVQWPTTAGATLSESITDAHYGEEQTISTTEPTGYIFSGWSIYNEDDTDLETDIADVIFTGEYEEYEFKKEAKFLMPNKNIVAEADFHKVYTVAEFLDLEGKTNGEKYYVQGLVSNVQGYYNSKYITYYISNDGTGGTGSGTLKLYNGLGLDEASFSSASDLTVGDKVIVYGAWDESHSNIGANNYLYYYQGLELAALEIVGTPVTVYDAGQNFDKSGLSLTATYNTGYVVTNYTGTTITSDYDVTTFSGNGEVTVTVSAEEGSISTQREITVTVSNLALDYAELAAGYQTEFWVNEQYKEPKLNAYLNDEPATVLANVTGVTNTEGLDMSEAGNKHVVITYTRKAGQSTTVDYDFTVKPVVVDAANAHSVATAREIIDVDKRDGEDLDLELAATKTHVIGRVTSVTALTGANEGKYTIVIKDQTNESLVMTLYQVTLNGVTSVEENDLIKAYGNLYYHSQSGKYEINTGGEVVWKQPKVSISIANKTLEIGDVWTIDATIVPAAAPVTYSIKAGSDDCITLATNVITATAEGTATIIASAAEYNDGVDTYLANSIEFEVEVVEAGSVVPVVILAQYDGQWYALMNEYYGTTTNSLKALAVDYNDADGVLFELTMEQQAAITWTRSIAAGKATFLNGTKYIAGGTNSTDLTLNASASEWTIDGDHYMKGTRTFLYNDGGYFKNFAAASNVGKLHYSDYPVVLANPQFMTRVNVRESLYEGKWGTICPAQEVKYPTGASFYTLTYKEVQAGMPYKVFFDEIAEGASLEAGKPYLFVADGETIKGVKVGDEAEHTDGISNNSYNGFYGILTDDYQLHVSDQNDVDNYKYYIVYGNEIRLCGLGYFNIPAERAYLDMSEMDEEPVAQVPGRRRVCLTNPAANAPTDIDAINASEKPMKLMIDGQLYILRGEKMFDATGRLVK